MDKNLVRLRKMASRYGKGSPEARDSVLMLFLAEIGRVVHPLVVDSVDDETLWKMYADWCDLVLQGCEEEQRIETMARGVSITPISFLGIEVQRPETLPSNVQPLFG